MQRPRWSSAHGVVRWPTESSTAMLRAIEDRASWRLLDLVRALLDREDARRDPFARPLAGALARARPERRDVCDPVDLPEAIAACARGGMDPSEIDEALIKPAALTDDEGAALWLLAWCSHEHRGQCG